MRRRASRSTASSMRMITDYVVATDQMITRLDVLYGYKYLRPEWLCAAPTRSSQQELASACPPDEVLAEAKGSVSGGAWR